MTGKSNFQAVAQNCSAFNAGSSIKSSKGNDEPTCLVCNHFKEGFCNIDKFDPILSNLT